MSPTPILEAASILSGAFLSGFLLSLSTTTIATLLRTSPTPAILLTQWKTLFHLGHIQGPALAITTTLLHATAACSRLAAGEAFLAFVVAGVCTIGIVPYTWVFMRRVNRELFDAGDGNGCDGNGERVEEMVRCWQRLHVIRALLPLVGAVVGLSASLKIYSI